MVCRPLLSGESWQLEKYEIKIVLSESFYRVWFTGWFRTSFTVDKELQFSEVIENSVSVWFTQTLVPLILFWCCHQWLTIHHSIISVEVAFRTSEIPKFVISGKSERRTPIYSFWASHIRLLLNEVETPKNPGIQPTHSRLSKGSILNHIFGWYWSNPHNFTPISTNWRGRIE